MFKTIIFLLVIQQTFSANLKIKVQNDHVKVEPVSFKKVENVAEKVAVLEEESRNPTKQNEKHDEKVPEEKIEEVKKEAIPSQEKVPAIPVKENVPLVSMKEKVPSVPAKDQIPVKAPSVLAKVPSVSAKEKVPSVSTKEKVTSVPVKEKAPSVPVKEKAPSVLKNEKVQSVPVKENVPSVPPKEKVPSLPVKDQIPSVPPKEKVPSIPAKDQIPSVPVKDKVPSVPVKSDTKMPVSVVHVEDKKNFTEAEKTKENEEKEESDEDSGLGFSFLRRIDHVCQVGNDFGVCVANIYECKNLGAGSVVLGSSYLNNGGCSILTCCEIHQTCGGFDKKKITYFKSPSSNQARDPCVYTINAMNPNICQVRLDFDTFSIAPASQQANAPFSPNLCRDDSFDVITSNGFKAPTLCGYNSGQHMYIPLNASNNETMLQLKFRLAPRGGNTVLPDPRWKIKVTQLECPYNNLYASANSEQDSYVVAPTGCIQYHTERTGTICNFGYNPQLPQIANSYVTNLKYSICFKRRPDACGILFKSPSNKFNLSNQSPDCSQGDYIFIPEGETVTAGTKTSTNSRFCTNSINSATEVISTYSGPFSIQFSSDNQSDPMVENGWCLDYQAPPATCY